MQSSLYHRRHVGRRRPWRRRPVNPDRQTNGLPTGSPSPQHELTDLGLGLAPPTRWLRSASGGLGGRGLGQPGRETGETQRPRRVCQGETRGPQPHVRRIRTHLTSRELSGRKAGCAAPTTHRCLRRRGSPASRPSDAAPLRGRGGEGGFGRGEGRIGYEEPEPGRRVQTKPPDPGGGGSAAGTHRISRPAPGAGLRGTNRERGRPRATALLATRRRPGGPAHQET